MYVKINFCYIKIHIHNTSLGCLLFFFILYSATVLGETPRGATKFWAISSISSTTSPSCLHDVDVVDGGLAE